MTKVWTTVRKNDRFYIVNKVVSFFIAAGLAAFTLSYKTDVWNYTYIESSPRDYNYSFLYWLLFLFYSFQALDEITELYTVMAEREKGAIGLLFEMNYFLGIGITVYVIYIVFYHKIAETTQYMNIYNFLYYQAIVFFVSLGAMLFVVSCLGFLQRKSSRRSVKTVADK